MRRERRAREHIFLALIHQLLELWPVGTGLVGSAAPGQPGALPIRLQERLAQRCRGHGLRSLADMGERVAHLMHAAALPGRAEDAGDRRLQPLMGIGDDALRALQAARHQALEEVGPEPLRPGRADVQADDLVPPFGVQATAIMAATETMRPPSR